MKNQATEVQRLEREFEAQHTERKRRNGIVLSAYSLARHRDRLPKAITERCQQIGYTLDIDNIEQTIEDFEHDFNIMLL